MVDKIPTTIAECMKLMTSKERSEWAIREIVKFHIGNALEAASKIALKGEERDYGGVRAGCKYYVKVTDKEAILSSYPEDLII